MKTVGSISSLHLALLLSVLYCAPLAGAQAIAAATAEHGPLVAPVKGFNFMLDFTTQHNSSTGWANVLTPDLTFRFNPHFSVDALVPWYLSVKDYVPVTVKAVTTDELLSTKNVLADTVIAGHYEVAHKNLNDLATASVAFPTGNSEFGLSANTVTYNISNHIDYSLGPFDPEIEIGEGNSSTLTNTVVKKPYVAVGPLANFLVGTSVDLPWSLNLNLDAYEDLPLGNQNIHGTVTSKNKNGKTRTKQVLEGSGLAEDNGFIAELDIPAGTHFLVVGTYERSLIQALDTVSAGVTWTLRRPKILK